MLLYVTDGLEPAEVDELGAHLASGCPRCAGALAEAQVTVAHLPLALPQTAPPKSARDRLLSRIAADVSQKGSSRGRMWSIAAAAACIGAVIASGLFWMATGRQFNPARTPDLQYVSLSGAEQPKARGRIFWDRDRNDWHVQVFDLKPPGPGRTYELWFITPDQKKVPAGTFDVDAQGRGALVAAVPPNIGPIALAAITDEPAGGVQVPTGKIHLLGEIK